MNEEFYRRQSEANKNSEHNPAAQQKNTTLETYHLEQQEAHLGHIPNPQSGKAEEPQLTLWQRIRKMIGL